jgi:hypothetical protein
MDHFFQLPPLAGRTSRCWRPALWPTGRRSLQEMYDWQNYLSAHLPVIWQPNGDYQLTENLEGVRPQSTTLSINPEDWYFTK